MNKFCLMIAAGIFLALLAGCMPKQPGMPYQSNDQRWNDFQQKSTARHKQGSNNQIIAGSLRFGLPQDTRRVTYMLWPASDETALPASRECVRLEVNAGAGPNICSAVFDGDRMTVLLHQEQRVFSGKATKENLRKLLGISLPMNMMRLKEFLIGDFFNAFGSPVPTSCSSLANGSAIYHIAQDGVHSELVLSSSAIPIQLRTSDGWDLTFSYGDDGLPSKMDGTVTSPDGTIRFLLLVKNRMNAVSRAASSSTLGIPPHYQFLDMDQ